jgi:hypothetical protein
MWWSGHYVDVITTAAATPAVRGGGTSRRLVALAVLAGLTFAALGAGAGTWLGWRDVPPMPFGTAERLAAVVAPDARPETVDSVSPAGSWVHRGAGTAGVVLPVLMGDAFGTGYEQVVLRTDERTAAVLDAAGSRLAAEGWTVDPAGDGVEATRDDLHLAVRAPGNAGGGAAVESVTFTLQREEPDGVLSLALIGAAAGAVLGAAATLLIGGRFRVARAAIFAVGVALLGVTVSGLGGLGMRLAGVELSPDGAQRNGLIMASAALNWMALAALALAVTGLVLVVRRWHATAHPRSAPGA